MVPDFIELDERQFLRWGSYACCQSGWETFIGSFNRIGENVRDRARKVQRRKRSERRMWLGMRA